MLRFLTYKTFCEPYTIKTFFIIFSVICSKIDEVILILINNYRETVKENITKNTINNIWSVLKFVYVIKVERIK